MKNVPLIVVWILLVPFAAYGQDSSKVEAVSKRSWQIDYKLGYLRNDHSSLDNSLKAYGFSPIDQNIVTYSIASKFFFNRLVVDFGAGIFRGGSQSHSNAIKTSLWGSGIDLNLGYVIWQNKNFRLYPYVGMMQRSSKLQLQDLTPVADLGDIVYKQRKDGTIQFNNGALDVGMHLERLIRMKNRRWDCPQNHRFMTVGLRAGYLFQFSSGEPGEYNGQELANPPRFGLSGPYAQVTIGAGVNIRKLKWR